MVFRGELANINLASVLQNLLDNEQTGTLKLFDEEQEVFLHFDRGHMTMCSAGRGTRTPVGEYLRRSGDLAKKQIAAAEKRRRGKRTLAAVLGRMGVEPEKVRNAIRLFVEEKVCDLFTWEAGRFEFAEGAPPAGVFDADMVEAELNIDPNGLILEAARRADTWDRINRHIRSRGEIFVLRKEAAANIEDDFGPETVAVARLLDGRRSVTALAEDSGIGRFPTMKALSLLIERGAARTISLREVVGLAEASLGRHEFGEAIAFYRRAIEIERNNLECRRGLIAALEGAGEKAEASTERKLLAATLCDMEQFEEAAEELRRAIEDAPTDITAREKHIALLTQMDETRRAENARLDLGTTYLSLALAEKARAVFAEVLRGRPRDPARVATMLAHACVKAGDVPAAVEAYRAAGSHCLAAEAYGDAAEACEEILRLQPDDAEAKKRLEDIKLGRLLRRKRRWRLVRYGLAVLALAALGTAWLVYDWIARDFLDEVSIEAMVRVECGDFPGALDRCAAVREKYPFTRAAVSAARLREALSERGGLKLLAEGKRVEELGHEEDALRLYRQAEAMGPSPRTLRLIRFARTRLEKRRAPQGAPLGRGPLPTASPDGGARARD